MPIEALRINFNFLSAENDRSVVQLLDRVYTTISREIFIYEYNSNKLITKINIY